jgi:predicted Zn-dependent protease
VTSERLSEAEERANDLTVKMRPDSPSFLLVREKCRIRQIGTDDAFKFYTNALKSKKYTSIDSQYYGVAFAAYTDKKYAVGLNSIAKMSDPAYRDHPASISLKAQLFAATNNFAMSNKIYQIGLDSYPTYKNLWLGRVDLFISSKHYKEAAKSLDDLSQSYPQDSDVWSRIAVLNSDSVLDNKQKYYYALGNQQYLLANYKAALEKYMLAIKVANADSVLNDVISAKISDTEDMIKYQKRYGA